MNGKDLFVEIKQLIEQSRQQVAVAVNSAMSMLYWQIGTHVNDEVEGKNRSEIYGKEIVVTLARQLSEEFGTAFTEKNLRRMMQFAKSFPNQEIVVSLTRQLSWTHILAIIPIDDPLKRDFISKCASWKTGAFAHLENESIQCFRNELPSVKNLKLRFKTIWNC